MTTQHNQSKKQNNTPLTTFRGGRNADFDLEGFLNDLSIAAVSEIPIAGKLLGPLLTHLTAEKIDIWAEVKDRVITEIEVRIRTQLVSDMRGTYNSLSSEFVDVRDYEGKTQYQAFLALSLLFSPFKGRFKEMSNSGDEWVQTLPFIAYMASLHTLTLSSLAELSKKHDSRHNQEVNIRRFKKAVESYSAYIRLAAPAVVEWRADQVELISDDGINVRGVDHFTGKEIAKGQKNPWDILGKSEVEKKVKQHRDKVTEEMIEHMYQVVIKPFEDNGKETDWGLSRKLLTEAVRPDWLRKLQAAIDIILNELA